MGLVAAGLVGSLSIGGGSIAVAQDASPEASPMVDCVPGEMSMAEASPIPEAATSPSADMASPVAEASPMVGTPADEATIAAATAAVQNIAACAASDPAALATLVTVNLVQNNPFASYPTIEEALADEFFTDVPWGGGVEVGDVVTYEDGSLGVDVRYMQSQYQVVGELWNLVEENGVWKLNSFAPDRVQVDGDSVAVGVNLGENEDGTYFITPNSVSAPESDVLIFQAINVETNVEPHELVVVQLPEGADPMGLLDGSVAEEDITFVGFVVAPNPGDRVDMTLIGLPVGVYTMLCFFDAPDGATHADHGMIATFEVTAPAE
jgi:hypothetical protein